MEVSKQQLWPQWLSNVASDNFFFLVEAELRRDLLDRLGLDSG